MIHPIPYNEEEIIEKTKHIRRGIVISTNAAGSGHPGGSLSATEILTVLYNHVLRHDPENPEWENRDRFILSKAHITPGFYSVLSQVGYFPEEELKTFRKFGSVLQGHPKKNLKYGIEISGGSLGQNLSVAVGTALGLKKRRADQAKNNKTDSTSETAQAPLPRVFDLSSEGELQEGEMWEAIMSAAHFKLNNLCCLIDYNRLQIDGPTEEVMEVAPLDKKFESFNWNVIAVKDGNNPADIYEALKKFNLLSAGHKVPNHEELDPTRPTAIIAQTIKGKGISFMENKAEWHGKAPNDAQLGQALKEIASTARLSLPPTT